MSVHDTIGDFITVIRNAGQVGKTTCTYPHSNLRAGLASILKDRGFVLDCTESQSENGHKCLEVQLKYVDGEHAIRGINRISTPGRRSYCGYRDIPHVLGGLGVSILSTPRGSSTTRRLQKQIGGNSSVAFGKTGKRNFIHEQNRKSTR